jgi:hypothetical protein
MLNLSDMSTPTQSNGAKIDFISLSTVKVRAERKKVEAFDLKYACEFKSNTQAALERKHNFILDKKYLKDQTEKSFCLVGANEVNGELKAFLVQSMDGSYGAGKNIMRVWKGENASTKITSSAIYAVLEKCGLLTDQTQTIKLSLVPVSTNLENCNVFEITPEIVVVEDTVTSGEVEEEVVAEEEVIAAEETVVAPDYNEVLA